MDKKTVTIVALVLIALISIVYILKSNETYRFKVSWDANTEADMNHYRIYLWTGMDTTDCPFNEGTIPSNDYFYKVVQHDSSVERYEIETYPIELDGRWIRAAAIAVDDSNNWSMPGLSNFYWTGWVMKPDNPKNVKLSK